MEEQYWCAKNFVATHTSLLYNVSWFITTGVLAVAIFLVFRIMEIELICSIYFFLVSLSYCFIFSNADLHLLSVNLPQASVFVSLLIIV